MTRRMQRAIARAAGVDAPVKGRHARRAPRRFQARRLMSTIRRVDGRDVPTVTPGTPFEWRSTQPVPMTVRRSRRARNRAARASRKANR